MNGSRTFYLIMMIVGTIAPWYFFSGFIAEHGAGLGGFVGSMYVNGAAAGAVTDLFLSAAVFWVWSYSDARQKSVSHWWVVVPATLAVGLSLALPLYLWLRAAEQEASPAPSL